MRKKSNVTMPARVIPQVDEEEEGLAGAEAKIIPPLKEDDEVLAEGAEEEEDGAAVKVAEDEDENYNPFEDYELDKSF